MADLEDQEKQKKQENQEKEKKAQALFEALSKPDVAPEKMEEIKAELQADRSLLTNYGFVALMDVPHLAERFDMDADKGALLKQSLEAEQKLKIVLDNLQKIDLSDHKTRGRETQVSLYSGENMSVKLPGEDTAAKYFLNNAYLANGETVGTQMVKNIHFLGTIGADTAYKLSDNEEQNKTLRNQVEAQLGQSAKFYQNLYKVYGANKNACNQTGQKVDDLMKTCLSDKRAQLELKNNNEQLEPGTLVKNTQNAVFMKAPQKATVVDAELKRYLGQPLTVEDQEVLKKKEAELANVPDPKRSYDGREKKGEKFKDEDMVKYMYEEIFLALMSWGCDKIEEGMEIAVDYIIDSLYGWSGRGKKNAQKTSNPALKAIREKTASFGEDTDKMTADFGKAAATYKKTLVSLNQDMQGVDLAQQPDKEKALREKYGDAWIDKFKASPAQARQFAKMSPEGVKNLCANIEIAGKCALAMTRLEMVDEVMRSDKSWRDGKKGEYLSNDELILGDKGFLERAINRQQKILAAALVLSEDARALASAEYGALKTDEERKAWVQTNIVDEYDALMKSPNISAKRREKLPEVKREFIDKYKRGMKPEEIYQAYAGLKVNTYLDGVNQACGEALAKQQQFDKDEKYDAVSNAPQKDVKNIIDKADKVTEQIIEQGVGYEKFFNRKKEDMPKRRTLEEEVKFWKQAMPLEKMLENVDGASYDLKARREAVNARKQRLEKTKNAGKNKQEQKNKFQHTVTGSYDKEY